MSRAETPLTAIIRETIREHGAMRVIDYMQLCLQHPQHGYYRTAQAVGASGDFITAPEISQIFGDLLGMYWLHHWQQWGAQTPIALVELGPGRGTLSADVMRLVHMQAPNISLHLVESNHTLRQQQQQKLQQYRPQWHDSTASLPNDRPLLIMANEFFDALSIAQWVGKQERCVALNAAGELCFTPEGEVTREHCPDGEAIMQQLSARLAAQGGAMLVIDYGYEQRALASTDSRDTLQAMKDHRYCDVLTDCGEVDLTAHVDFTALAEIAQTNGLEVQPVQEQGSFLQRLGGDLWLKKLQLRATPAQAAELEAGWLRLISPTQMGRLFKVLAVRAL